MIRFDYLRKGVNALARAHHVSNMAGHLGAAFVAAYFVGEQHPDLDVAVARGIESDLDRIMRGQSVFGTKPRKNVKLTDPQLFEDFPKQLPDERLIERIAEALSRNISEPRESGHNVIFASIALRALHGHPQLATPDVVDGIAKLIAGFDNATPGSGYYGKPKGRIRGNKITLPDADDVPAYDDLEGMATAVMDRLIAQDAAVHRQGYGGLVHINNHAAAIAELARLGYDTLIAPAIRAHRRHLRLWANLPDLADELGPVKRSTHTPDEPAYWAGNVPDDRALLTHRVKTMYGFDELADVLENDARRARAHEQLRLLM